MFFFDLDGTLIDSNGIWKDVDRTFLARRGLPIPTPTMKAWPILIFPLAAKFTKEFCHLSESCGGDHGRVDGAGGRSVRPCPESSPASGPI